MQGGGNMRRLLLLTAVAGLALGNTGCFLNIYSSDPNRRMNELLKTEDVVREMARECEETISRLQSVRSTPLRSAARG